MVDIVQSQHCMNYIAINLQIDIPYRRDKAPVSKERRSCISAGGTGVLKPSLSTKIGSRISAYLGCKSPAKLKSAPALNRDGTVNVMLW